MKLGTWGREMYTGIGEIDKQHIQLFDLAKKFLEMDYAFAEEEKIGFLISKLNEGWQKHIAFEEEFMLKAGYPALAEHKTKHVRMAEEIVDFVKKSTSISELSCNIDSIVKSWLAKHILEEDKKFAGWMKENNK